MSPVRRCLLPAAAAVLAALPARALPAPPAAPATVRPPAVAGLFYPADANELRKTVDGLLGKWQRKPVGKVRALICPHAGYEWSGLTAAAAYRQLDANAIRTAIVLAPSHYTLFRGASVAALAAYRTPLGQVPVAPLAAELARSGPFVRGPECRVFRPGWWRQSPARAAAGVAETPHTWEHSLEVQLPFLQRVLKDFRLVPVVFGDVDAAEAAKALLPHLDDATLVVASSDLSHQHPYEEARRLDAGCVRAALALDSGAMARQEACGKGPILTVLQLASVKGWKPILMDYRTSGDAPGGPRSGVVGYMSFIFVEAAKDKASSAPAPGAKGTAP